MINEKKILVTTSFVDEAVASALETRAISFTRGFVHLSLNLTVLSSLQISLPLRLSGIHLFLNLRRALFPLLATLLLCSRLALDALL